ncbi:MAG: DinB family protein [Microscillaceae bacterium]|jgi:hypothetical protein|nr:DinB family protein [Microscillaceae bacterium]
MKNCCLLFFMCLSCVGSAQTNYEVDFYRETPDVPTKYTAESVMVRMIDGLGLRFYWATEGLRSEDLAYRPSPEARTCEETIDHIMLLNQFLVNTLKNEPISVSGEDTSKLSYTVKRQKALAYLQEARELLTKGGKKLKTSKFIFQQKDKQTTYPFWYLINGPVADALWHVGQIVSFRRASGNPIDAKASLFTGKIPKK